MVKRILFLMALCFPLLVMAQEEEVPTRNRITFGLGHTLVGQGVDKAGKKVWLALPMWVIDYDHSIGKRWSLGLHTDIITESFVVEGYMFGEESTTVERSYPVATLAAVSFKPARHAVYSIGFGGEFSHSGSYFMTRLGFEYVFELPGDWELSPGVTYDIKWKAYDSFSIGLAVGKKF